MDEQILGIREAGYSGPVIALVPSLDPSTPTFLLPRSGFLECQALTPNSNRLERMIEYYCHQKLAPSPTEASRRSLHLPLIIQESPRMRLYPISGRIPQSSLVTDRLSEKADKPNANVLASQEPCVIWTKTCYRRKAGIKQRDTVDCISFYLSVERT